MHISHHQPAETQRPDWLLGGLVAVIILALIAIAAFTYWVAYTFSASMHAPESAPRIQLGTEGCPLPARGEILIVLIGDAGEGLVADCNLVRGRGA